MTELASLLGARIRRIDAPDTELLALTLYSHELRTVLIFCFTAGRAGVGLVSERPHGAPANSFVQKLRKELENARLIAFHQPSESTLALELTRSLQTLQLRCDFAARELRLERADQLLISHSAGPTRGVKAPRVSWPATVEELYETGPRLLEDQASAQLDGQRLILERVLRTAEKRLQRRLEALAEDIARADQAPPLRTRATLLLAQERQLKRGQTSVELIDYTVDPPAPLVVTLDPARTIKEQLEAWFKQARRFERGAAFARERARTTQEELERLTQLRAQIADADPDALDQIAQAARALGVKGITQVSRSTAPTRVRRKPYREFHGYKDRAILVGKGAADNDLLTREHARPHDLWLHARDVTGAHVVVPLERNETCPDELLLDAAHLAAHFSDARGETQVDVSYVGKRYVRKPKGAAPGLVQLEREKVLPLRLEPSRLARLLTSERSD